eukprot:gene7117-8490_t
MTAVEGPGRYWEAVNLLVTIAIAATFPLQLFPASEILAMLQAEHPLEDAGSHSSDVEETRHLTSPESNAHVPVEGSSALANSRLHNLGVTLGCISLAVMVDDVSLMVAFFGALCQTGIVIVPTLMHVHIRIRAKYHLVDEVNIEHELKNSASSLMDKCALCAEHYRVGFALFKHKDGFGTVRAAE